MLFILLLFYEFVKYHYFFLIGWSFYIVYKIRNPFNLYKELRIN